MMRTRRAASDTLASNPPQGAPLQVCLPRLASSQRPPTWALESWIRGMAQTAFQTWENVKIMGSLKIGDAE